MTAGAALIGDVGNVVEFPQRRCREEANDDHCEIEIEVDDSAAQAFAAAPAERREQLRHLIAYLIEHFAQSTPVALLSLMDEMSKEAQDRGLTSTRLESLLNDE